MKNCLILLAALWMAAVVPGRALGAPRKQAPATDAERWEMQARNATIIRDDWGIAHVYGKTDADTVFGMMYAQCEDDFNRVETNYLNSMGRLAEAEGESRVYQDLRMKMLVDPETLKKQYAESPDWLRKLMDAFADGTNFYLSKHPEAKPRVLHRFEPWMALSFTEGSIGGDFERIDLKQLAAFYGERKEIAGIEEPGEPEPSGSNGIALAPSNTGQHHALLLIQPTHLLLLSIGIADGERRGPERLRCCYLGPVLHLPGIQ